MRTRLRKRTAVLGIAVVGVMGAVGAGFVLPASAGDQHTIEVEKVVVGTPPPGTTFTIQIDCTTGSQQEQLVFNGPGTQPVLVSPSDNTCTVSEPDTGGADSVVFACADEQGASSCTSSTVLDIFEPGDSSFTVTNTFDPSTPVTPETPLTPATPVPGTPRFTG